MGRPTENDQEADREEKDHQAADVTREKSSQEKAAKHLAALLQAYR